eukprot:gene7257-9894_t
MDSNIKTSQYLDILGFNTTRLDEKSLFYADFIQLSGDIEEKLTLEHFKAHCLSRNFSTPKVADVSFKIFDRDHNQLIDCDEYVLFRATITNFVSERDNNTIVMDLRLYIVFKMYDYDNNNVLSYRELQGMIRDMAQGPRHTLALLKQMQLNNPDISMSLKDFFSHDVRAKFAAVFLSTGALLTPVPATVDQSDVALQVVISDTNTIGRVGAFAFPLLRAKSQHPSKENFNVGISIESRKVTNTSYRGLLVDKNNPAFDIASTIIENARILAMNTFSEVKDMSDNDWLQGIEALSKLTGTSDIDTIKDMLFAVVGESHRIIASQPVCVHVPKPAKVFGDVHGQLRDLLLLFREFCFPSPQGGDVESVSYVFNGDFVDRGSHQVEVVFLLFSLKVAFPSRVFLVRGNHEFRAMNKMMSDHGNYGFNRDCEDKFGAAEGAKVFESIHNVFDWLPWAAIVDRSILVVHGGIGTGDWTINDLENVLRPIDSDSECGDQLRNLLWSDPDESDERMQRGVHMSDRGAGIVTFSRDVTRAFCRKNNVQLIIRSHQNPPEGFRVMHDGLLITVFSARNYFDQQSNDGAILLILETEEGKTLVKGKKLMHRELPAVAGAAAPAMTVSQSKAGFIDCPPHFQRCGTSHAKHRGITGTGSIYTGIYVDVTPTCAAATAGSSTNLS